MPRATANTEETTRKDLKTCPDGFVILRPLTYGQMLHRRGMSANLEIEAKRGQKDFRGMMALMNQAAIEYEFAHCIVDHNLEDEHGVKLNLTSPADIQKLDPRVGSEIGTYIDELNQFDEEGNS